MADTKISALPSAGALAGTEPLPIVQGGATKKTTVQDIADLAAGNQTLAQTLTNGNVTGGTNVKVNNADAIELENTSLLKKGTYDFGGTGGISRICSVGYEDMWQSGIHHVFDNNGFIRESTNCFNYVPDISFDNTLRFKVGSRWVLDDGTIYVCSDATTGAAVWAIGGIPDLQQVTDAGFTTTNAILSDDGAGNATEVNNGFVRIATGNTGVVKIDAALATANYTAQLPDKAVSSTETFAMLSDLTGLGGITKATAAGTDIYTTTIVGVTGYVDGDTYLIRFTNGNTQGATLNINDGTSFLGAKSLYRNNDGIIIGGDIWAGAEMLCVFNSTLNGFQCIGTSPNSLFAYVVNADSVTINRGQPVYAFGSTGNRMSVKLANNQSDATSAQTYGLVYSTSIAANQKGIIIIQGVLDGLNLGGTWADGDPVYLGASAGAITKTKPYAPEHLVYLGVVERANAGNGIMYVRVQNGYELQELHNVSAQTPNNGDILKYNSTTALWESTEDLSIAYALILG